MGTQQTRSNVAYRRAGTRSTSLADALFTTTQQRILRLLFGNAERTYFQQELIAQTGSGSGAVQRELARLVESGLVIMRLIGSQKHYQANRHAPIFEELRGIVMKTVGLIDPLRSALRPLAKRIDRALVYGSVAKGMAHAGSDIDLLVVASDLTLEELFAKLAPTEKRLGRSIHPTLYTPAEFARRKAGSNPFLRKVLAGEHVDLIGTGDGGSESR
ncbi:MAG TPA: nucleotidyltransferase domain-containing protein [Thermoanaerobaculia bacterium]|jgi:predicted nucleotidyltransferase|nr:nucleotidyltransferase domain-containing protein [Thermoanaerobaculia bacterium]